MNFKLLRKGQVMVNCVDTACRFEGGKFLIVFESDKLDELLNTQLAKRAIDEATRLGWTNTWLNGQTAPEPVDEDGNVPNDYAKLVKLANSGRPKYRKTVILVNKVF